MKLIIRQKFKIRILILNMKFWRTNYYLPGHSTEIALSSEPASLKGRFKILGNEDDELL